MLKEPPSLPTHKEFGYSKIKWSIKSYFAATNKKKWSIDSPHFHVHGDQRTGWQLSLKIHNMNGIKYISVYLKCLEPPSSKLRGNWKVFNPFDPQEVQCEIDYDFGKKDTYGVELCSAGRLEDVMQFNTTDMLMIKCQLIVYRIDRKLYDRPKDPGLKSLSQDMRVLYSVAKDHDIEMFAGGESVKAHRAVLCSRNEFLKDLIEISESEIELPDLTSEGVEHVMGYLYSGNLDYVLRTPSFSIWKCIKKFKMKELGGYYKRDSLVLCSEFKADKYVLEWKISDMDLGNQNCFVSDIFQENDLGMSFRLYLYSEGFSERETDYVSIFIEIIDGKFPRTPYFEFAVMDSDGGIQYLQRKRWSKVAVKFGLENFLLKDVFRDLTKDGCLKILCNVMFYSHKGACRAEKKIRPATPVETEHHYELLSEQISNLFVNGLYSDFTISCEGRIFEVHSCILGVRSYVLKNMFQEAGEERTLQIQSTEYNVLVNILSYIYSGKLVTQDFEEALKLYRAAESLCILPLKYACSSILQSNLDESNISEVLALAYESKDYKLRACALRYSSEIISKISLDTNELDQVD